MRALKFFCLMAALFLFISSSAIAETYVGGQVSGTWTTSGSPYYVIADLEVPFGETLTIEPGVEVKFTDHFQFIAHGNLTAVGAPGDSILITHSLPYVTETWAGLSLLQTEGVPEVAYCIIEYGYAEGELIEPYSKGGGIHVYNTEASIHNCRLSNNKADDKGGAIYLLQAYAEIYENVIVDNYSSWFTAGIFVDECDSVFIHENMIQYNTAGHATGVQFLNSYGILEGNDISHNHAFEYGCSGVKCNNSSPEIQYNVINFNTGGSSTNGTGIYLEHYSSPLIAYNEICQNQFGAVFCGDHCSPELNNNTLCQNDDEAILVYSASHPTGCNNIITGNGQSFSIYGGCSVTMDYSDIQGGWPGVGNFDAVPYFVDPNAGDYSLQPYSPCIDAGDPLSPLDPDSTVADMGANYFDQSGPQGICTIDLTPFGAPILLPPTGGMVEFGLSIINTPDYYNIFDGWYNLMQPDSQIIPMVLREGLALPPGATIVRELYLIIDQMAMPGIYTITAYVGDYSLNVESFDSFTFEKSAGDDLARSGGTVTFFDGEVIETFSLKSSSLPATSALLGHFPEPFNPRVTINFALAMTEKVKLEVFDVRGRKVATLLNRKLAPGFYSETFDGSDLASGIYIYALQAGVSRTTGKMVLLK